MSDPRPETTLPFHVSMLIDWHGGLRPAARAIGCDPGYLSRLQSGEKTDPSDHLLHRLGLRRVVIYERLKP